MKNNNVIFVLGLCPLIPCSSNFAYGIIITLAIWFLFFATLLARSIVSITTIQKFSKLFVSLFVMICACIFDAFIRALFPIIEIAIRFYIFVSAFSYILVLSVDSYYEKIQSFELPTLYSITLLCLSLIRELISFGSISLPGSSLLITLQIIPKNIQLSLRFFGSTAGAFILLGVSFWIYVCITKSEILPLKRRNK